MVGFLLDVDTALRLPVGTEVGIGDIYNTGRTIVGLSDLLGLWLEAGFFETGLKSVGLVLGKGVDCIFTTGAFVGAEMVSS